MKFLTAVLALAGCASVSEPAGLAPPGLAVTSTGGVRVIGPDFEMDFAPTGLHLPNHLTVSNGLVELLGVDGCAAESLVGYGVTPAVSAAADLTGPGLRSEITTPLAGPAVVKVHVTFEVDYLCPAKQTMAGAVDFTVFPSGRVVREDLAVTPSTSHLIKAGSCGCQQTTVPTDFSDLHFTSYWAFQPSGATQVQASGVAVTEDVFAACTMYPQRAIGVSWNKVDGSGTATRFHANVAASHILDWPTTPDRSTIDPVRQSMTSAIQISNTPPVAMSDCGKILDRLADVPLQIGDTVFDYSDHDGIYRDPARHGAAFTIAATTAAVPAGFAVSVDLGGASHATFTRRPAAVPVGLVQREAGDRFLIVFTDGLAPGEAIAVEPRR